MIIRNVLIVALSIGEIISDIQSNETTKIFLPISTHFISAVSKSNKEPIGLYKDYNIIGKN